MRKINTFWNWFQDNNQTIKNGINETIEKQEHILFWVNKHLGYYCKEIDFIILFPSASIDKTEFIITANGNPEYFNQVIDLIDNAPKLKTWKFTAFIKPNKRIDEIINALDQPYIMQEITLKTKEPKFLPLGYDEVSQKFDIIVFRKNYNLYCDTKTLKQAIFIIIQGVVGEKSLYQNINFVLVQVLDNKEGLIHLYDLQFYIDETNKK